MTKRKTQEQFVQQATHIHSGKYDYSTVVYVNTRSKVNIKCPTHGVFRQTPNGHLNGWGCKQCKNDNMFLTTEAFKNKATNLHRSTYSYDKVEYVNSHANVVITCQKHGDFTKTPNAHLSGMQGCPQCTYPGGKYKDWVFDANPLLRDAPAKVYLVQIKVNTHTYNKIGITKRSTSKRYAGLTYITVAEHTMTLYSAWKIEQQMLTEFQDVRQRSKLPFSGWSEVLNTDVEQIKSRLSFLVGEL